MLHCTDLGRRCLVSLWWAVWLWEIEVEPEVDVVYHPVCVGVLHLSEAIHGHQAAGGEATWDFAGLG